MQEDGQIITSGYDREVAGMVDNLIVNARKSPGDARVAAPQV
jgi:hypothetical protein